MPENLSNVLNRHAFADQICGKCPAEAVRVDIIDPRPLTEVLNNVLDALFCETAVWILESNKQRWIVISPAAEVTPEVFGADLAQIKAALLAALADHSGFAGDEIDTGSVQGYNLGHTETGSVEKFTESQVSREQAGTLQTLTFDCTERLPDDLIVLDLLHGAGGVLGDHSLIVEPSEKCGDGFPHIFEGAVGDLPPVLVERQVEPQIIRRDLEQLFVQEEDQLL